MCPACMTTIALVTAAVTSTAGITAMFASQTREAHRNQGAQDGETEEGSSDEHAARCVASGMGGSTAETPGEGKGRDPRA